MHNSVRDGGSSNPSKSENKGYAGTSSMGISGSVGVGPWIFGGQAFFTVDANGYLAFQYGFCGGIYAGATADQFTYSLAPLVMVTNAPGYQALEGNGLQAGVSFAGVSLDYVGMLDTTGQEILYHGVALTSGGTATDVHVTWGVTKTWFATLADWDLFYKATRY